MNDEEYRRWVAEFIAATGSEPGRVSELLMMNRQIICQRWHATYEELCEATNRIIASRVSLRFDQITAAIGAELERVRQEGKADQWRQKNIDRHGEPPDHGKVPLGIDAATRKAFAAYVRRGKADLEKEKRA